MTKSFSHYITISPEIMDVIEEDLTKNFDNNMEFSKLMGNVQDSNRRNSKNAWIPTTHWLGGLMWHYFKKANDEIFHYSLDHIDGESMQYTHYSLKQKYDWHQDENLAGFYKPLAGGKRNDENLVNDFINYEAEKVRKLSCILQLSDPDDYEGGGTQLRDIDNSLYNIPRERGTLVFFDSRLYHRAKMVHKGLRKSLIVWAVGRRWK